MILSFTSPLQATWCPIPVPGGCGGLDGAQQALVQSKQDWVASGVWNFWHWEFPSLALDGVALPQTELVCNLGFFLDSWILSKEQGTTMARRAFAHFGVAHELCPFWTRRPSSLSLMLLWSHIWINEMLCTWECPWRAFRNFSWCKKLQHGVNKPMEISGASYLVHVN